MKHLGDYDASTVIYGKFTTFRPSTGAAFTLGGTPALSVYKDNSTTQSTTGVTLTVDFDGVTGLHHYAIDTSADGTFYSAGSFFDVVITTGTVDSVSVVGTVVASFTIRKDSSLKPTTAGRTLDVSAGGEAGVDWANVGSPTTTVNLSGTTVKTATDVETDTQDIQSKIGTPAGASVSADIAAVKAETATIVADTNELQTDWVDGGRLDLLIDAIKAKTDNLPTDPADASDIAAAIAALNDLSAAEVNAEVVDALATDTYAEPTGVPGATVTLATKINYLYMALRNGITVTSSKKTFLDDGGAGEWSKPLSDDGTTYTEGEGTTP